MYIVDQPGLAKAAAEMATADILAIDTEFMRERTYYARLCLLQFATPERVFVVDPLARGLSLDPLRDVLGDPAITKVFHAGGQDMEILQRATGVLPSPVFDTQVAATLAGFPTQVGYAQLMHDLVGITIDKADTFTDWSVRPLTAEQLAYAAADVEHLPEAYALLRERLERDGRLTWLAEDFSRMADPATYAIDPREQYRRVKRANTLDRRGLGVLREVAAWREMEAQRSDIPRRWLLSDESLVEIARRRPKDTKSLAAIRGVSDKVASRRAAEVVRAIESGEAVPDDELPRLPKRDRIPADAIAVADLLSALVRVRAREHGIAPALLASRDDLEHLASGDGDTSEVITGWRRTIVGAELEGVLSGSVGLGVRGGRIEVRSCADDASDGLTSGGADVG